MITCLHKIELQSVDSTNNYALNLLRSCVGYKGIVEIGGISSTLNLTTAWNGLQGDVPEGTVIITKSQTGGRGQRQKYWESEDNMNLTLSVIYFPDFLSVSGQFVLNKVISLAVTGFVRTSLEKKNVNNNAVKIKWPNDIYYENKKIGGILIENIIKGSRFEASVIGIGININQHKFSDAVPNPTSLKIISGELFDLNQCLEDLCIELDKRYQQLKASKLETLHSEYVSSLYLLNEPAPYIINGIRTIAIIKGITAEGKLKLETNDMIIECNHHEVVFEVE